jgi:hypothetical protein
MASEPVRDPAIDGVKVTLTVHVAPELREEPQVLLGTAKLPVAVMELTVTAAALVFLSVTSFDVLVVPTSCRLRRGSAAKATQWGCRRR